MAICSSYRDIYDRHRGPYTLLLMREKHGAKDKVTHQSDRERGPFTAEEAHETARMLVGDPRDDVIQAWVFSENEQQHIGAYYERGQTIPTWDEEQTRITTERSTDDRGVDVVGEQPAGALLPGGGPEPMRGVDAPVGRDLPAAAEQAPAVRDVPAAPARERRVSTRGARLQLDAGNAEAWPKSRGAQLVRTYLEDHPGLTASEIGAALAGPMTEAGVDFPTALISRLKQAGYLKECDA